VGPPHVVHVQLVRHLAREVDGGLGHHLDDLGVDRGGGPAAGRARLVAAGRSPFEQRLRDLGAPRFLDADEQHVAHAASLVAGPCSATCGRASARRNWYTAAAAAAPSSGAAMYTQMDV